jgi:hypothetical protein
MRLGFDTSKMGSFPTTSMLAGHPNLDQPETEASQQFQR